MIRFDQREIESWIDAFREKRFELPSLYRNPECRDDVDAVIARAKLRAYTEAGGQTKARKEG